jgi:hypothetical protein
MQVAVGSDHAGFELREAVKRFPAAERFLAITDPGSQLQQVAERDGSRHAFFGWTGTLPVETPIFTGDGIKPFTDEKKASASGGLSAGEPTLAGCFTAHLGRPGAGDDFALLACIAMNEAPGRAFAGDPRGGSRRQARGDGGGSMTAWARARRRWVFTTGPGEHAAPVRARGCEDAAWLGVCLDPVANLGHGPRISAAHRPVSVRVIPTDEELMIARHGLACIRRGGPR